MKRRVDGKVAIVTGAASGMGAAIAAALAAEGGRVVVADINEKGAERVASDIVADGGQAISARVDVVDRSSLRDIATAVKTYGQLDILFNNAAVIDIMPFMEMTEESWERQLRVNGTGVMLGTQEGARQMIAQKRGGKIINTASIASYVVGPESLAYCASKFLVSAITKGAAKDLGKHGITVNNFAPGIIETPFWDIIDDGSMRHGLTERKGQAMEAWADKIILDRRGKPSDVAKVAMFLASQDSHYMTDQTVMVDGGITLL